MRFIHNIAEVGVLFRPDEAMGAIGNTTGRTKDGAPMPLSTLIHRAMSPAPGKEKAAEQLFEEIERRTIIYRRADEINLPSLIRSALLMPAVSRLLGIGDAILPTQTPRWLRYPYLRLGHLVQTAALSTEYGIQAAKVSFGGIQLTSAAFGVQPAELYAEQMASYAMSGHFDSDLGALVYHDAAIVRGILRFRSSAEGESFRREIGQVLAVGNGRGAQYVHSRRPLANHPHKRSPASARQDAGANDRECPSRPRAGRLGQCSPVRLGYETLAREERKDSSLICVRRAESERTTRVFASPEKNCACAAGHRYDAEAYTPPDATSNPANTQQPIRGNRHWGIVIHLVKHH